MNARENPFEADRIERLLTFDPSWLGLSWEEILDRAENLGFRGSIIGPHGSGKTTFCDAIAPRLEAAGYQVARWFLNDRKTEPDADELAVFESVERPESTILMIDGREFLKAAPWRKLYRKTAEFGGLFATAHAENGLPKPRLPVFLRTEAKPEMLVAFATRLAPDFPWDETELRSIFKKYRGNLRESLWACYDRVASIKDRSD